MGGNGAPTSRTADAVRRFAGLWTRALLGIGFIPFSTAEVEALLTGLTRQLVDALDAEPFSTEVARAAGGILVAANFTDTTALEHTLQVFGSALGDLTRHPDRVPELQAALAAGYAHALRSRTMTDQEQLSKSILTALWNSEARFRAIFAGAAVGISIADTTGRIVDANQAFADMLGYSVEEIRRKRVLDFLQPGDNADTRQYARMNRGDIDHTRVEKVLYRKDGTAIWVDLTASLIRDKTGAPQYTVAVVTDITERSLLQARLRHQASHDPLTGLANRRLFTDQLEAAFKKAEPDARIGICFLDLDRFKYVNDSHGHDVGDQLLVAVARRLERAASTVAGQSGSGGGQDRQSGSIDGYLVARVGGDEFVVLVPRSAGVDQITALADHIMTLLAEPIQVGPHRLDVTASIGVVEQLTASTNPSELTKAGDTTLQWAKADGRGRWALFDPQRHAEQASRYRLASTMAAAIEGDEFTLEYQPLVRIGDGSIVGLEALVRWQHPRLGTVSPNQFIGLAEETGLIVPLGRWVLRKACVEAASWSRIAPAFVSVNLAVAQVREPELVKEIAAVLDESGLDPRLLQLELTESAVMSTSGGPLQALRELAAMGVRIAIDDFGTGYSNLAYLRSLPVHTLKLAGTFIENMRDGESSDRTDEQIVENLIRLAHTIGLTVTAEAVETETQLHRLQLFGCDMVQGWYVARAVPPEFIPTLLAGTFRAG
jgi:PAS domain S-box-containing protein